MLSCSFRWKIVTSETLNNLITSDSVLLNKKNIADLLSQLREFGKQNASKRVNFDNLEYLSDADMKNMTGLKKESFIELCGFIRQRVRSSSVRSTETSLGIF